MTSAFPQFADSGKVMIIDDNIVNLEMLRDFLETKHFRVFTLFTADDFLSQVGLCRPDVVLMDIKLPGMDGLEATRRLRAMSDATIAATPIFAVTALPMPGDRERCLNAGINEYVVKPVILRDLIIKIKEYVRKDVE